MRRTTRTLLRLALGLTTTVVACAPAARGSEATASTALGWRFGPGLSCKSTALFVAPPVVIRRRNGYALAWTQGSTPFFFEPSYQAIDGRLVFVLQATSSSGNRAGRHVEIAIEGSDNLASLERGGAYWWEPDGSYVTLRLTDETPQ